MMGHLNSFSASGGGNLNKNFPKIQMPGGFPGRGGVMFKLRFDWYIRKSEGYTLDSGMTPTRSEKKKNTKSMPAA